MKHISITGDLGSGKSSVSAIINEKLNYKIESIGSIQRQLAQSHGLSINEFNKYMEEHPEIDHELDNMVSEIGRDIELRIFDSRLAWHFVPHSFKVYLYTNINISTERVLNDKKRINESYESKEVARQNLVERRDSEIVRFKTQYDLDINDFNNFDLVVDTGYARPEEIADLILCCYDAFISGRDYYHFWLSPNSIVSTENSSPDDSSEVQVVRYNDTFYLYSNKTLLRDYIEKKKSFVPVQFIHVKDGFLPNGHSVESLLNEF